MTDGIKKFMSDAAGYFAVAAVSLFYIAMAVLVPGETGKSLGTIIADGAASFLLGVCINFNLNMQGVLKGERSERMLETKTLHANTVSGLSPFMHLLDGWCATQNDAALQAARARILMQAGLRYADCFDADGVPMPLKTEGLDEYTLKRRRRAMRAAIRLRLSQLSAAVLTGEGGKRDDPYDLGENVSQYIRHTNLKDMVSKVLIALLFGYFGVRLIENFSYAELIWRALQVAILLAMGVAKLTRAYLFMVDTYRGNIVRKINYLQSFGNWANARKEQTNGEQLQPGELQIGAGEAVGSEAGCGEASGLCQSPKAAQISAPADGGAEPGNDRDRQDRGE